MMRPDRAGVIFLLMLVLATAMVAETTSFGGGLNDAGWDAIGRLDLGSHGTGGGTCNGRVGDCIDEAEELMMENEPARRVLAGGRFISYGALRRNSVPCNRRGRSYYNCNARGRANPYRRGCSAITRCARR